VKAKRYLYSKPLREVAAVYLSMLGGLAYNEKELQFTLSNHESLRGIVLHRTRCEDDPKVMARVDAAIRVLTARM
jgi:hypothetical protein